jgi:hypothetical protein
MTEVKIVPSGEGGSLVATVNGTPIPIASYVAEPDDNGRVMVSLIVAADTLQIGVQPARRDMEQTRQLNKPPASTWGDRTKPDPRAHIPGWQPPPQAADAGRGHSGEHRLPGDNFVASLRKLVSGWRLA